MVPIGFEAKQFFFRKKRTKKLFLLWGTRWFNGQP
jgi:hypothetical protein